MRRTFPSFGLKSVIRLCAFMLTMCVLINSERANAQAPSFRAGDTARLTICYPGPGVAVSTDTVKNLGALLAVDCTAGDVLTWTAIATPGGVTMSGSFPLTTTTGVDERMNIILTSNSNNESTRYLTIRVRNSAGLSDSVVVLIKEHIPPTSNSIVGLYNSVHEGETISFTNASAGGTWHIASGTRLDIDSNTGVLRYGSGPVGSDNVVYRKTNVCYTTDSLFPINFLLGTGPLSHSATGAGFTPTIIASDTAWGVPGNAFVINGTNFNATASSNIVYFGGARASVISGTTTSLSVTIPLGATFDRISVMDNATNRTGFMRHPFTETFNNCAFSGTSSINLNPYDSIILRGGIGAAASGARPYSVEFSDLDGDGKLDMAICGTDTAVGNVVVYRNTSTTGTVNRSSFSSSPISLRAGIPDTSYSRMLINLKIADMDGDGKPDIMAASPATGRVYILRNTSTSGTITFDTAFAVSIVNPTTYAGVLPSELSIADYDHDGRPDIGVVSVGTIRGSDGADSSLPGALTVIKNNYNRRIDAGATMRGTDFVANTIFTYDTIVNKPLSLCSGDFDGDGNMDIAVADHYGRNFKVFQHVPTATSIAFNAPTTVSTAVTIASLTDGYGSHRFGYPNQIRCADFNRDGKQELIVAVSDSDLLVNNRYNHLNVYSNNLYGTGISFGSLVQLNTGVAPVGIAIADLNGDHALDIVCTNSGSGSVSIIKNTSSGGGVVTYSTFDTANIQQYVVERNSPGASATTGIFGGPVTVAIGDIDNNSINDFVVVSREANLLTIVKNTPLPTISPITTSSAAADTICIGSSVLLTAGRPTCSNANGFWSASNGHATVTATGTGAADVTATAVGVSIGVDTIFYKVVSLFDTSSVMKVLYVVDTAHAGSITGSNNICLNASTTLSNTTGVGGTWSTSAAATATITSSTTASAVVRGDAVGAATITYTATAPSCPSRFTTFGITVNRLPNADTIAGNLTPCTGSSTTYTTSGVSGGTWMLTSTALATITTTSGTTASLHAGTTTGAVTMMYIDNTALCGSDTAFLTVNITNSVVTPISGAHTVCNTFTTTFTDATSGGTWTTSNAAIASVSPTGVVTGVGVGTAIISYSASIAGCSAAIDTQAITVIASPGAPAISGADSVCKSATTTLTTTGTGGAWSSTDNTIATVNTSGVVTGVAVGSATISYTVSNTCGTAAGTHLITVNPLPNAGTITGTDSLCPGITVGATYTSSGDAGTWSVTPTTIATIDAAGFAYGVATGSALITYSTTSVHGCGTVTTTKPIFIRATANPGTVSGPSPICENVLTTYTVTGGDAGGTWSASGGSISAGGDYTASVGTGSPFGTTQSVTYSVTNICGTQSNSIPVTVRSKPTAGSISGPTTVCTGVNFTETLAATTGGGGSNTWKTSNATIASVASSGTTSGIYRALSTGTVVIYDSISNACGFIIRNLTVTVNQSPNAGTIAGPSQVCVGSSPVFTVHGSTDQLGGIWSSISTPLAYAFTTDSAGTYDALLAGRGIVTYEVVNTCGRDTAYDTVNVVRLPAAGGDHATIDTICPGTTVVLTADATGFATLWASSDPTIATTSASGLSTVTVTGVATGNAVIYSIDSNVCGTDTAMYNVHVNPAIPTPGIIYGVDSICKGLPFVLSDTSADITAGAGVWSTSTGSIASISSSTTTTVSLTANTAGTAIISYVVRNSCGADTATKSVKVNDFAHLTSLTSLTTCDSVSLNYNPTADTTGATFAWIKPLTTHITNPADTGIGGFTVYLDNDTSVNQTVVYNYTVSAHGCVTNSAVNVTVKPTPRFTSTTNVTVCSAEQFLYLDSETVAGTNVSWLRPTTIYHLVTTGSPSGTSHRIADVFTSDTLVPVSFYYTFQLNAAGCVDSAKVKVTVNPRPAFPTLATHPSSNICSGTMYMNFGSSVVPPAGVNYAWSATNAVIWATGNTRQYSLVNFTNPGTAYVYLLATLPGYSCAAKDSFGVIVSNAVSDNPTVIYFNGDFICLSNTEDSYQWGYDDHNTLDSATFPGQTNQNYTELNPDFNGKWYWVITTHNGCEQKSYYKIPTGVKTITGTMGDMKLYPNPAEQFVNVEVSNTSGGSFSVEVMNMLGQKISSQNMIGDKAIINVADLAAGVYFVDCYRDGVKFATEKFVKN